MKIRWAPVSLIHGKCRRKWIQAALIWWFIPIEMVWNNQYYHKRKAQPWTHQAHCEGWWWQSHAEGMCLTMDREPVGLEVDPPAGQELWANKESVFSSSPVSRGFYSIIFANNQHSIESNFAFFLRFYLFFPLFFNLTSHFYWQTFEFQFLLKFSPFQIDFYKINTFQIVISSFFFQILFNWRPV